MRFWDSSALLPLVLDEPTSPHLDLLLRRDSRIALWWGTEVECTSALYRLHREGVLSQSRLLQVTNAFERLRTEAFEVQPRAEVRTRALRLLAIHRLRAGDALQLAAALVWCREQPRNAGFVSLDNRLRAAGALEGFEVLPYAEEVHELDLDD